MTSLLVTNDFPPKQGGIQTYLHELWRRLPPDETTVLTPRHQGAEAFDDRQAFRVERTRDRVLLPRPGLAARIDALATEVGADVIFLDPTLPLGLVAGRLRAAPTVVIVHGSELTVPGRLPGTRSLAGGVLRRAAAIVAAGTYPAREAVHAAGRALPGVVVPPGIDPRRFRPLDRSRRRAVRERWGLDPDRPLVLGLSRLVPRKGFDVLCWAVAGLPGVQLAIGGAGRDRRRLERIAAGTGIGDRVRFLGRVPDDALADLYGAADVFSMLCRHRWGGLEAEGFGIVFLEAAACGVPSVAGRSGGSHEAVADGETGFVVEPRDAEAARERIRQLVEDPGLRDRLGDEARRRAEHEWSWDRRVARLAPLAGGDLTGLELLEVEP